MRPALRYLGGKWRLAPWILSFFPRHQAYLEPFGGAASVLLQKERVAAECYNERDDRVVAFFRVLRDPIKATELKRRASLTPFARAELQWAFGEPDDEIDAAHRLVVRAFMGHGSDSAIRRTRTGFRSKLTDGRALPAAEWSTWHDAIPAFQQRLTGVVIENDDALRVIDRMDEPRTLIYCDPPYLHGTRTTKPKPRSNGYQHEMSDGDHEVLADRLRACRAMVVVSGYPSALYDRCYEGWIRHDCKAMADMGRERREAVWLNPAAAAALEHERGGLFANAA